jgi:hypothetical protein
MTTLVRPCAETIAWITNKPTGEKKNKKTIKQVKERNKNTEELAITQRELKKKGGTSQLYHSIPHRYMIHSGTQESNGSIVLFFAPIFLAAFIFSSSSSSLFFLRGGAFNKNNNNKK